MISIMAFHCFRGMRYGLEWDSFVRLMDETPPWLNWIWNADKSLDIFFVISGFLIAGLLFREYQQNQCIGFKSFYIRRFLRLSPVYFFAMLIYWLASGSGGNVENLWTNMLYINNFLPIEEQAMGWCWSLAVEEQFYLIFPIFLSTLFFNVRYRMLVLGALFLLSFFINYIIMVNDEIIWNATLADIYYDEQTFRHSFSLMYDKLHTRYACFITGIAAAYLHYFHGEKLKAFFDNSFNNFMVTAISTSILAYLMASRIYHPNIEHSNEFKNIYIIGCRQLFGAALSSLILAMLYPKGLSKAISALFSSRLWYPIAQLSYSMYLFHFMIVFTALVSFKANLDYHKIDYSALPVSWMGIVFATVFVATIIVSVITYLLIEKPFMNLRGGFRAQLKNN